MTPQIGRPTKPNKARINLSLDKEIIKKLKISAYLVGLTASDFVEKLVEKYNPEEQEMKND
ncbi:MAG: hypothetical protein ACRCZ2_04505 [Fusobacteriaceae bacterium]